MKRALLWVVLLWTVLVLAGPSYAETYCLRADGTAGSKTAATDCLTVGNCMDVSDHDGETFAANDEILVCAHGGEFDSTLTPQSSGTSGNEILYTGVPDGTIPPTFDDGFDQNAQTFLIVQGIRFQPGVAESGTTTFEGGRFANTSRTWQAAEEVAVTNWDRADVGIYAVGIGATGGSLTPTPQLYWRDKTDAGSFATVGAAGEVKQSTTTALTDEANLTTGNFGTSSGKSAVTGVTCEQENSYQATSSTSLSANEFTELQVGISFADADEGHEYEFSLYESAAQIGVASAATVTTGYADYCASCTPGDPTDLLCEDAEGSTSIETGTDDFDTAQCGWTPTMESANSAIYEAAHVAGLPCVRKGDYAIEMAFGTGAVGGDDLSYLSKSYTQSDDALHCFYYVLKSDAYPDSDDHIGIAAISGPSGTLLRVRAVMDNDGGGGCDGAATDCYNILARYLDEGCGSNSNTTGSADINYDEWVRICVRWDNSGDTGYLTVDTDLDGTPEDDLSNAGMCNSDSDEFIIGASEEGLEGADQYTSQYDLIGGDATAYPGVCTQ